MSVNRVFLLGNVGKEPEIRDSQAGKFATLTLATTDKGFTKQDAHRFQSVPSGTIW